MSIRDRKIRIFKSGKEGAEFLLGKWKEISGAAIRKRDRFTAALSGGRTPVPFYQKLAGLRDPQVWERTHIFQVDERFVPAESEDSNYGMMRREFLDTVPIPRNNIHPVPVEEYCARAAAERYEADIRSFFGLPPEIFPRFDFVLLGIGEDGHTASLFPRTPRLAKTSRIVAAVVPESAKHDRITLTLPVLNSAGNVFFMVTGKSKAAILKKIVEGTDAALPASMVEPESGRIWVVADAGAASLFCGFQRSAGKQRPTV
ncbi:MAG: 6-phosphogluconolactonase [Syntrophales bacterium]